MFPGASAALEDASYAIVGAPLDVSASFRPGARFGPDRIRSCGRGFEDYDQRTGATFTDLDVYDHGDVRAWDDAADYLEYLRGELAELVGSGTVPALLGGEHTVSIAAIEALDPRTLVCLDAHLDLRSEYDGNPWSHATVAHHALDTVEKVVILGGRAGSEGEWDRAAEPDVTVVPPESVAGWSADVPGPVYLSMDLDAVDPGFAPATGTPEPFGLTPSTARDAVRSVAPEAIGFDVVEVTDRDDGQTATLAAKLVREFVFAHADAHR